MYFEADGFCIHYEQHGAGKDLLLLHGWGGQIASWLPFTRDFSKEARVTVIDFPGFGKSPEPPEPWSVTEYAKAVARLVEGIGIQGTAVVAHSFGGRVALVLAALYPRLVGRIVLSGVPGVTRPGQKKPLRARARAALYKALKRLAPSEAAREWLVQRFGSEDYRALSPSMRPTFNRVVAQDLTKHLSDIQSPTLLVWGEGDTAAPLWMAKLMEERIPDAGLVVFEGQNHFAYLNEYARFRAVAHSFLLETEDKGECGT